MRLHFMMGKAAGNEQQAVSNYVILSHRPFYTGTDIGYSSIKHRNFIRTRSSKCKMPYGTPKKRHDS